jgi:ATP-binding protein involved in chromosome partitioning
MQVPDPEDLMATPQENARLEQIKRSWQQRRQITDRLGKIKTKIGVYSGKGGVGKTTVAVNLAVTLASQGSKVGLLDVDIDCPNVAKVMGITDKPDYVENQIIPSEKWGVKVVSMAFFQENPDEAIIWRGPMIHNAISQFLQSTDWDELDYLVVDLPPGTSDSPLTVMQNLPMDGFVVVSTPQDLANLDAKRCINMIRKLNLNVLGVVENYTGEIFGEGGGKNLAKDVDAPFLGDLALRSIYRDSSKPTTLLDKSVEKEFTSVANAMKKSLKEFGSEAA